MGDRGLSRDERAVLELLWAGKSQREAAEVVGVSRRTVQYWVKRPAFREEWEARKAELWREIRSGKRAETATGSAAMERSWETMTAPYCKASRRGNAARQVLGEVLRVAMRRF